MNLYPFLRTRASTSVFSRRLAVATLASAGFCFPALGQVSFVGLGDLPGGLRDSRAYGISADGSVVVGESSSAKGADAIVYAAGAVSQLGDLPGGEYYSQASAVAADGSVIVGTSKSSSGGFWEAFRFTGGTMSGLGSLRPSGSSRAFGVSADGSVIVGESSSWRSPTYEAFRYANGTMVGLGDLAGGVFHSRALAVSGDGSVVVGYSQSASGVEAFRHANGNMVSLGELPGGTFASYAKGISADGTVIVGSSQSGNGLEAFRYIDGAMIALGDLPGGAFESDARGASADGSLIVGYGSSEAGLEALIWNSSGQMTTLNSLLFDAGLDLSGWSLNVANAISADGSTIVGVGTHNGYSEGWIVRLSTPIPEPGTYAAIAGVVALGVVGFRRTWRSLLS